MPATRFAEKIPSALPRVHAAIIAGVTLSSIIIKDYVKRGKTVLFVVHRRELIQQTIDELAGFGIWAGAIQASDSTAPLAPVQVAMVQTLHARCIRRGRKKLPHAHLMVIDDPRTIRSIRA